MLSSGFRCNFTLKIVISSTNNKVLTHWIKVNQNCDCKDTKNHQNISRFCYPRWENVLILVNNFPFLVGVYTNLIEKGHFLSFSFPFANTFGSLWAGCLMLKNFPRSIVWKFGDWYLSRIGFRVWNSEKIKELKL